MKTKMAVRDMVKSPNSSSDFIHTMTLQMMMACTISMVTVVNQAIYAW
jgi:hypothetical protein